MVVDVERTYRVDAPIEAVWEVLSDPTIRAESISVVDRYTRHGDVTVWHLSLPLPLMGTISVRTWDVERDPPRFVRFVGESSIMDVTGEHELTEDDGITTVRNRFRVDGSLPGVESFFTRHIDDEINRIKAVVEASIGDPQPE